MDSDSLTRQWLQLPRKFEPFLKYPKTHNIFEGGRGGAKTRSVAGLIVEVMRQAPINVICGREIQKSLKESSYLSLKQEIYRLGYGDQFNLKESDGIIESPSGGRAVFIGLQQHTVDSIKSYESFHWAWIEEAQSVSKRSLETLIPTLRTDGWFAVTLNGADYALPLRMFVYTLNPYSWDDPINFVLPESRSDVRRIKINHGDNPWFPKALEEERREAERIMSPEEYDRIWNGIPYENAERAIISRAAIREAMERRASEDGGIVVGADIARFGDDSTVFVKRRGLQVVGIKTLFKQDTQEVARQLADYAEGGKINIDDTGVGCITMGSMVLTPSGWVKVEELKEGDKLYSKDDSGNVCIESVRSNEKREPTRIVRNGEFEFSFSHILPYKTRREYDWKQTSWENILSKSYSWLDSDFNYDSATMDFELPEYSIKMPNGGIKKIHDAIKIPGVDFAKYLGWYISEGNFDDRDASLMVTQKKNFNIPAIVRCSSFIGKPQIKKDGVKVFNKPIYDWVKSNCYKEGYGFRFKTIPRWVSNNSREVIDAFLQSFAMGDGYYKNGVRYYCTSSKWLPHDLLELIYKIGKKGNVKVKYKAGSKGSIFGREITRKFDHYCIYEYQQKKKNYNTCVKPDNIEERTDNVYELCITGDTSLYFMLCPGSYKPIWTHNGGVTDKLRQLGANVVPINFGGAAMNKRKYPDIISEMWFNLAELLPTIGLRYDEELLAELSSRHFKYTADERRKVESKEEYKKRTGRRSPDRADATILCFYNRTNELQAPKISAESLGL